MKHEPLIFFDPILKSSLYDELEVQEIFWPESEHTTYKSHRQYHSRGRKRYLEKVSHTNLASRISVLIIKAFLTPNCCFWFTLGALNCNLLSVEITYSIHLHLTM